MIFQVNLVKSGFLKEMEYLGYNMTLHVNCVNRFLNILECLGFDMILQVKLVKPGFETFVDFIPAFNYLIIV